MKKLAAAVLVFMMSFPGVRMGWAIENEFSGNYLVPKYQSGYNEEAYEAKVGQKFLRGAQNFTLSPLEIFQGVKSEYYYRKQEYLPAGAETVFIGMFKGLMNGIGRAGVGLYEMFSAPYPQDPILPEMKDWLY